MRTTTMMLAAGVLLATTSLQAGNAQLSAEQQEMHALLQQMSDIPANEYALMEEVIMQPTSKIVMADAEKTELLGMLDSMELPKRERALMRQAILAGSYQQYEIIGRADHVVLGES